VPNVVFRYSVFGLVALSAVIALCSWLVRTRRVSPFGALGKTLRAISDPVMRPVERRLVRMGGNPANAGGWLIVVTAVLGIVLLSLVGWLVSTFELALAAAQRGPRGTASLIVEIVYKIIIFALGATAWAVAGQGFFAAVFAVLAAINVLGMWAFGQW